MQLLSALVISPLAAFAVTVEPLPTGEFADTEVSTNIAFAIDLARMSRVAFTVSLDATPTNGVEVAIGTDANGDGNLSIEESAYAFGCDCGYWFCRDMGGDSEENATVGPGLQSQSRISHTFVLTKRKLFWEVVHMLAMSSCHRNMVFRDCQHPLGNVMCLLHIACVSVICPLRSFTVTGWNHCRHWPMNGRETRNCRVGCVLHRLIVSSRVGWLQAPIPEGRDILALWILMELALRPGLIS